MRFAVLSVLSILCFGVAAQAAPPSVQLEELTWTEVRAAIQSGTTTVIVPAGGTEQSGPHIALGKHNVRARVLAGRIAAALGDTLVAPVLAYVPEGGISPPTGHMLFPGTISIPEAAFKSTLEAAGRSLRQAGFTHIVLVGDHGGYQSILKQAAADLNKEWAGSGIRAHYIQDYYRAVDVAYVRALRAKGLSDVQIGSHAGTADTSLTLAIDPSLVRSDHVSGDHGPAEGTNGDPGPSSAALGQLGVDLVVSQTVAAILEKRGRRSVRPMKIGRVVVACSLALGLGAVGWWAAAQTRPMGATVTTVPGMPAVADPANLYSETVAGKLSPAVKGALSRVYVPNRRANTVSVIDPETMQVVDTFKVGRNPQHVVPSWDLKTLWVANNAEGRTDGSLTPIDPLTGKAGPAIPVDDPYNVYFSPDGKYAIIVAEELKRLDFRNPQTMKLEYSIATPKCGGINHADFAIDGSFALFTCEFDGAVTKIDLVNRTVLGTLILSPYYGRPDVVALLTALEKKKSQLITTQQVLVQEAPELGGAICTSRGMPQDIRISPDGTTFFVADMLADGVHVVDGASFKQIGFISTGIGAHGLYPSRDGKSLYVANRGTNKMIGRKGGKGSVSVIDFATRKVVKTWPIPGGGSPDMGNVSADGKYLWLSGRFDDEVYRIETTSGAVDKVKVGREPHGLTVWPQPGRYSLGHTGNLR